MLFEFAWCWSGPLLVDLLSVPVSVVDCYDYFETERSGLLSYWHPSVFFQFTLSTLY